MLDGLLNCKIIPVTIASGQTTSSAADLGGYQLVGIQTPAALTSTAITFTAATGAAGTYTAVYDYAGTQYTLTVSTSRWVYLEPVVFAGMRYIKLVGGSSEGADRTINLIVRAV